MFLIVKYQTISPIYFLVHYLQFRYSSFFSLFFHASSKFLRRTNYIDSTRKKTIVIHLRIKTIVIHLRIKIYDLQKITEKDKSNTHKKCTDTVVVMTRTRPTRI